EGRPWWAPTTTRMDVKRRATRGVGPTLQPRFKDGGARLEAPSSQSPVPPCFFLDLLGTRHAIAGFLFDRRKLHGPNHGISSPRRRVSPHGQCRRQSRRPHRMETTGGTVATLRRIGRSRKQGNHERPPVPAAAPADGRTPETGGLNKIASVAGGTNSLRVR